MWALVFALKNAIIEKQHLWICEPMNIFAMNDDLMPSERVLNAASFGQLDNLLSALDDGGDANYVRLGIAPTLITAMRSYTDCLQLLMERGARGDVPNRMGWTALHEVCQKEEIEPLQIILSYPEQTTLTVRDKEGHTALRAAMAADRVAQADLLVKADDTLLSMADLDGVTPVMWAVLEKKTEWLEWCLRNGADIKRENEKGQSALSLAAQWDEGAAIIESQSSFVVEKVEAPVKLADAPTAVEPQEEAAPANPFGLGGLKKKTLS